MQRTGVPQVRLQVGNGQTAALLEATGPSQAVGNDAYYPVRPYLFSGRFSLRWNVRNGLRPCKNAPEDFEAKRIVRIRSGPRARQSLKTAILVNSLDDFRGPKEFLHGLGRERL